MATRKKTATVTATKATAKSIAAQTVIEIPDVKGVDTKDITTAVVTANAMSSGLVAQIEAMPCVTREDYTAMDGALGVIRENQKKVDTLFNDDEKGLIRPIRIGLDRLYALQRALLAPFNLAETEAKKKMAAYKLEEDKIKEVAEREERARIAKQQDDINKEMVAKAKELGVAAPVVKAVFLPTAAPAPVKGDHSRSRIVEKIRVTDMATLKEAIECGLAHADCLTVIADMDYIKLWFDTDPDAVRNCPGIEVYKEAQIGGR